MLGQSAAPSRYYRIFANFAAANDRDSAANFNTSTEKSERINCMKLRVGDLVEVRSVDEILKTLDSSGALDLLPFMPEMLVYCGKRFKVWKRVHKTCDTIYYDGTREIKNVVMLDQLRCDGSAHGGCQAACSIFWKEAWLKRVGTETRASLGNAGQNHSPSGCTVETLYQKARNECETAEGPDLTYSCQATEMRNATTRLPPLRLGQYFEDVSSGNVSILELIKGFLIWCYNTIQKKRRGGEYPYLKGKPGKTPRVTLNLQPGELVQVRSRDEIVDTVDVRLRNRGLSFDREMVRYCGGTYKVLRRVEKLVNEKTGKMMQVPNDCLVLDGVICVGHLNRFCPRSVYPYWREIWLKRADGCSENDVQSVPPAGK